MEKWQFVEYASIAGVNLTIVLSKRKQISKNVKPFL